MTTISHEDLVDFLRNTGWRHGEPGKYGSMWALGDTEAVGITHSLDSKSANWGVTLERIGLALSLDRTAVEQRIVNSFVDEIAFQVPTTEDAIPLSVGVALLTFAQRSVRASAASSEGPRAVIANVPKGARRIIEQVTVAHTRPGSYVVPIRYQLDRVLTQQANQAENAQQGALDGQWEENRESRQRRASRTLMQALGVLDREVVRPEKSPTADTLRSLIPAGVTRELVVAVRSMVVTDSVDQFRATATWAAAVKEPAQTPPQVVVEREAEDLLRLTAEKLASMKPTQRGEVIAGPLVSLDTHGAGRNRSSGVAATVGVQVVRHGRQATVNVDTEPQIWGEVNRWLESGQVVTAFGTVRRGSRGLVLDRQGTIGPIGQGALPGV